MVESGRCGAHIRGFLAVRGFGGRASARPMGNKQTNKQLLNDAVETGDLKCSSQRVCRCFPVRDKRVKNGSQRVKIDGKSRIDVKKKGRKLKHI